MPPTAPSANASGPGIYLDRDLINQFHADALKQQADLTSQAVDAQNQQLADLQAANPGPWGAAPPSPPVPADQDERERSAPAPIPDATGPSTPPPTTYPTVQHALAAAGIAPAPSDSSAAPQSSSATSMGPSDSSASTSSANGLSFASLGDALNAAGIPNALSTAGQAKDAALGALGQVKDTVSATVGGAFTSLDDALHTAGIAPRGTPTPTPADQGDRVAASNGQLDQIVPDSSSREAFIQTTLPLAQAWEAKTGIPAAYFLAVNGSESNWGKAPGNELFGIKARPGNASTGPLTTWEAGQGAVQDSFSAYPTANAAYADFVDLISHGRYAPAWQQFQQDHDPAALFQNLNKAGYATDPQWASKIATIASGIGVTSTRPVEDRTAPGDVGSGVRVPDQFGLGLSQADAVAFCGPVAAMALAQRYGDGNIPIGAVKQAAAESGWNQSGGMNGVANEQTLLDKMGVKTRLETNVDWSNVRSDAQNGNPVVISTAGHYFVVDGFNQNTGAFHVGQSGQVLTGGSDWMTPDQMSAASARLTNGDGTINGALYVDNPNAQAPSVAERQPAAPQAQLSVWDRLGQGIAETFRNVFGGASDALGGASNTVRQGAQAAAGALGSGMPDVTGTLQQQGQAGSPLGAIARGQNLSPPEQLAAMPAVIGGYEQAREQATENLNPAREVPVVGGAINAATDPLTYVQGAATDAALRAAGHVLGPLAGPIANKVSSAIGDAVSGVLGDAARSIGRGGGADPLASTELNAGLTPQAVGRSALREFQPSALAPQDVQAALNRFDGAVRVGEVQVDDLARQGLLNPQGVAAARASTRDAATQAFLDDVRNSSGVTDKAAGAVKPAGWMDGASLPASANLDSYWIDPNTATVVNNTLTRGASTPVLTGLGNVVGAGKQVILEGSPFHLVQLELQGARLGREQAPTLVGRSMANAINPAAYDAYATAQAQWYERAAQAGVTQLSSALEGEGRDLLKGWTGVGVRGAIGGAGGALQTYLSEKDTADPGTLARDMAVHGALGAGMAGGLGALIGPALWERAVPTLKVESFRILVNRGLPDEAAAAVVNNAYGGQNLVRMARSSQFQDALRAVTLAPDWWESIGRNLGSAALGSATGGGPMGRAEGAGYLGAVAANLALVEGINWLATGGPNGGHFTWDNGPGHQWDLAAPWLGKTTNDQGQPQQPYIDALGWLKPVIQAPTDVGAFARGRASLPLSFALEAVQNKNPATGKELVATGTPPYEAAARYLTEVLAREMPAGASGLQRSYEQAGTGGAIASGLTGLRVSAQSDAAAARARAAANPAAAAAADPLQTAYRSVGLNIAAGAQSVQVPGSRSRIEVNEDEGRRYAGYVRDALQQMGVQDRIADPSFMAMPANQRAAELRKYLTAAQQEAAGQFVTGLSSAEIAGRVQDRANATPTPYGTPRTPAQRAVSKYGTPTPSTPNGTSGVSGSIAFPFGQRTSAQGSLTPDGGPDDAVTPGAIVPGLHGDALRQYSQSPRGVSPDVKRQVYAAYGIDARQQGDYEIDHRIPRALGGSDDISNLWPQPKDSDGTPGYHAKDIVEAYLIAKVRGGSVPLEQAQRDAAYNWRDIYNRLPAAERQKLADQLNKLSQSERDALTN